MLPCRTPTNEADAPLVVNGWTLYAHPLFLNQLETLAVQVQALREKDSTGYTRKNATKRLAAITRLAFELIPENPERPEYRQGSTLGGTQALVSRQILPAIPLVLPLTPRKPGDYLRLGQR